MGDHSETETPASYSISMDPSLYKAAMEGKNEIMEKNKDILDVVLSPNNNTVLHIAAQYGKKECVTAILKACPVIHDQLNARGETPLHIAVREGHLEIVNDLLKHAKDAYGGDKGMLMQTNEEKDTVLHAAVRNSHTELVKLLTEAAPELSQLANHAEETPLYLAAEKGLGHFVDQILTCKSSPGISPGYGGPLGRTALHAAVIRDSQACMERLLSWKQNLLKAADAYGWTALHYAARFGYVSMVRRILEKDKLVAYIAADKDDKKTALHIATSEGQLEVMKVLISECPGCWEMVNSKGQNILHIAVKSGKEKVMKYILTNSSLGSLINQKDADGNTPLHLLVISKCYMPEFIMHPRADKNAFNKKNLTPLDVLSSSVGLPTIFGGPIERALVHGGAINGRRNLITIDKDDHDTAGKEQVHVEKSEKQQWQVLAEKCDKQWQLRAEKCEKQC